MKTLLSPIPKFVDHKNCKGHQNWMLDCEFTKQEDRDTLIRALENHIEKDPQQN